MQDVSGSFSIVTQKDFIANDCGCPTAVFHYLPCSREKVAGFRAMEIDTKELCLWKLLEKSSKLCAFLSSIVESAAADLDIDDSMNAV